MQTGRGLRDLFVRRSGFRRRFGRWVAEFAKSSFYKIFQANRESAKIPPELNFANQTAL